MIASYYLLITGNLEMFPVSGATKPLITADDDKPQEQNNEHGNKNKSSMRYIYSRGWCIA